MCEILCIGYLRNRFCVFGASHELFYATLRVFLRCINS